MEIVCAYCRGKGRDPFGIPSALSDCQVCIGRGKVRLHPPVDRCPTCRGSGRYIHHRLPCAVCHGKGSVTKLPEGKRCQHCRGKGLDPESELPCSTCYGLGSTQWKPDRTGATGNEKERKKGRRKHSGKTHT